MSGTESFDEKRERLLRDPNFHLIKVVRTPWIPAEIESLTIVTPSSDPDILQEVSTKGWDCLSHLWGPPKGWIEWDDSGVISADTGEPVKVNVNPNKRAEISGLFLLTNGFWWVDVFCARSDTPLVIMGDIYRFCNRCYALLGGPCDVFGFKLYNLHQYARVIDDELEDYVQKYLNDISTKKSRSLQKWWNDVTNHNERKIHKHYIEYLDEDLDDALREHDPGTPEHTIIGDIIRTRDKERWSTFGPEEYWDAVPVILDSPWMTRVWTLQESALSPNVLVRTEESDDAEVNSGETSSFEVLRKTLVIWLKMAAMAYRNQREAAFNSSPSSDWSIEKVHATPRQLMEFYRSVDPVLARVYLDYRKLLEALLTFGITVESEINIGTDMVQKLYLNIFATCLRKATFSLDYVYGVLGIMDIDIPRTTDAVEVWRMFSEKLQEKHPEILVPRNVDLINPKKMSDVFGQIGFINENFILDLDTIDMLNSEPVMDSD